MAGRRATMPSQRYLRLPILTAVLLQLILGPPTFSFSLSPSRRFLTPLQAAGKAYNDKDGDVGSSSGGVEEEVNAFEQIVRRVTRNEEYKFGDITRSVVNTTTTGVEDAVKAVTHDEDYHFGDFTKKAIGSTTGSFEGVVKSVTGNENYRFGDLTRGTVAVAGSAMTYSEKTLSLMRDHNIHELAELLNIYWSKTMNEDERNEAFIVIVYLGAILVLAYNFVANAMSGMVFAAAWTKVSMATGMSPMAPGMWAKFLQTKNTLNLFFGGPCVPARAIITIPWFFAFRRFVIAIAHKSPLREKFPTINRYLSLLLTYTFANLAFVGGATYLLMKILSLWSKVPLFPAA